MPVDLDALDAYASEHGGVARVETVHEYGSGSASCGHSLLCILVLPAVFVAPFIPRDHQLATIESNGVAIYQGRFQTDGAFIQARVREDDVYTDAERLHLPALGRDYVVLTYRTRVGAPATERTDVPLREQLDLVSEYREVLATEASPDATMREAIDHLGADVAPLLVEHVEHGARPLSYSDGRIVAACERWVETPTAARFLEAFRAPGELRERLVRAIADRSDDPALDPALVCLEPSAEPSPSLDPFVRGVTRRSCSGGLESGIALAERLAPSPPLLAVARDEASGSCESPGFRLAFGASVEPEAIGALLDSPDRRLVAQRLDPTVEAHRAALFAALSADVGATAHRLTRDRVTPTRAELDDVLRALARPGLMAGRGAVDLLRLFAAGAPADRRAALAAGPAPRPELGDVLAVLGGDRTHLDDAARSIHALAVPSFVLVAVPPSDEASGVELLDVPDAHVPLFALWLAGCPENVLREAPPASWAEGCTEEIAPRWERTLAATTVP